MFGKSIFVLTFTLCTGTLLAQSDEFGKWVELFDGESLEGWTAAKKSQGPNRWIVDDGALTNGKGGQNDICTVDEFGNFELELWYKFPRRKNPGYRGNSGIYLRGQVEVQLFDSHGVTEPKGHDAGSIYGGSPALSCPQNPPGHWNKMRILNIGHRITVYHNGYLVQDNTYRKKRTPGHMPKHPVTGRELKNIRGPVMFQGDHSHVWYRNIRIRPICDPKSGWKPLFNGENLSDFRCRGENEVEDYWKVEDDASFTNTETGSAGEDLWTRGSYGNFLVHYEYRVDPTVEGGNSGFYLRDQWEIQIHGRQDTVGRRGKHLDGALYSLRAPSLDARNDRTRWNVMDAKVQGMKIWVWQNGILIHDGVRLATRTDNHGVKTEEFSRAPFKLQGDHGKVWFTNLYIKELPE